MIFFGAHLDKPGQVPRDRFLALLSVLVTGVFVLWVAVEARRRKPAPLPTS